MLHPAVGLKVGRRLAVLTENAFDAQIDLDHTLILKVENAPDISECKYVKLFFRSGYLTSWARVLLLELVYTVLEFFSLLGFSHVAVLDHEVSLAIENIINSRALAY